MKIWTLKRLNILIYNFCHVKGTECKLIGLNKYNVAFFSSVCYGNTLSLYSSFFMFTVFEKDKFGLNIFCIQNVIKNILWGKKSGSLDWVNIYFNIKWAAHWVLSVIWVCRQGELFSPGILIPTIPHSRLSDLIGSWN